MVQCEYFMTPEKCHVALACQAQQVLNNYVDGKAGPGPL